MCAHVLWIHDRARAGGGAESYLRQVVPALRARGLRSSLLYEPGYSEPELLALFDQAWPAIEPAAQIRRLQPDLIYLQRLPRGLSLNDLLPLGLPLLRLFHDHQLFCLREHKYTAFKQQTCTRPLGPHCYSCSGPLVRGRDGFELRSLTAMQRDLKAHHALDCALVASDYMAGHLRAHGFDEAQIRVLPLFAAGPVTPPPPGDPRELLFAGQLVTGKGLDLLLAALTEVPEARLTIAGDGRQAERYRQQAQPLGERVRFLGACDPQTLAGLYARSGVVVMPSRAPETFGLSGLEALAQGRPVIASAVGGMSSWLKEGGTGLSFVSGDVPGLAQAIRRLIHEPGLAERLGRQGHALWQNHFQLEHHLQGLTALMQQLIQTGSQLTYFQEELRA